VLRISGSGELDLLSSAGWLWHDGEKQRLRGTRRRPHVLVGGINDRGKAVGTISSTPRGGNPRPVVWRNGVMEQLPLPANGRDGGAIAINNRGLVVGSVGVYENGVLNNRGWWWRLGGRSGPLPGRASYQAIAVNDHDRVIDTMETWAGPTTPPRPLFRRFFTYGMDEDGHVTGSTMRVPRHAYIGQIAGHQRARLPDPPSASGRRWEGVIGIDLAHGVSAYAPHGGITVAGNGYGRSGRAGAPILWTCAQTYLQQAG
jgi:hypothetical protein